MPNDLEDYSYDYFSELQKTVIKLSKDSWKDLLVRNRNNFLTRVYRITSNGERDYYDTEKFDVYRAEGKRYTRTGLLRIDICEENMKKIKEHYGFDISRSLLAVIGVIDMPGDNHGEYSYINDYIKKNKEQIMYLVNLFGNEKADTEELFEIVDKCIEFYKRITGGQLSGGEISYA